MKKFLKIMALALIICMTLLAAISCDNSSEPTEAPTSAPTEAPTSAPTDAPTSAPTEAPTSAPTEAPTSAPTEAPTSAPTEAPTSAPTEAPTSAPTEAPTEPECTHAYDNACDTDCNECGETRETSHTPETVNGRDATCTEDGYTESVVCSVCDAVITPEDTVAATGHTEEAVEGKDATCAEAGLTDGVKCSVCDEVLTAQTEIPALPHTYDGDKDRDCNVCGAERKLEVVEVFDGIMQNMFDGNRMVYETVMFIDYGQQKQLLYTPDEIIAVTSYDRTVTYVQGVDYDLIDGCLVLLEGSSIPCITSDRYYGGPATGMQDICYTYRDGVLVSTYWGENDSMTKWQINVEYTHSEEWDGFVQQTMTEQYSDFLAKLERGEDVTVFFYGDSITVGANASGYFGTAPNQPPYTLLVVDSLARLYGYSVEHAQWTSSAPRQIMNYGDNGTITYINTAVGGWSSADGVSNYGGRNKKVNAYIEKYGCDLFIVAFGMNDGGVAVADTVANVKTMIDETIALAPDCAYLIVSTMVPNPDAYSSAAGGRWLGNQPLQEAALLELAKTYQSGGVSCAVAQMTSVSQAILEHKDFVDYTGNNINHPNDFFSRVYAQTIIQTLIGYENIIG